MKKSAQIHPVFVILGIILLAVAIALPVAPLLVSANTAEAASYSYALRPGLIVMLEDAVLLGQSEQEAAAAALAAEQAAAIAAHTAPLAVSQPSHLQPVSTTSIAINPGMMLTLAIALVAMGITMVAQPIVRKVAR